MKTQVLFGVSLVRTADSSAARSEGPVSAHCVEFLRQQHGSKWLRLTVRFSVSNGRLSP